jgi:hypothetical protein
MNDPAIAFAVRDHDAPAIEVLVNFGVFSGREATRAEIDRLADWLLPEVGEVTIVTEERHAFDRTVEAFVHVVRIEVPADRVDGNRDQLEERIVERAAFWARDCISDRQIEV